MPEVVFVAAENGLLPGAKVGGIADVVRDLPQAIAQSGWTVTILTPSYGTLHRLPGATLQCEVPARFRSHRYKARAYQVPVDAAGVRCIVIDHDMLAPTQRGVVYHGDEPTRPFATDASKFAFFCAAIAGWLEQRKSPPEVIHLHDWHCGVFSLLREYDPRFANLRKSRVVFTIHNLSYQGQRPFRGDPSALESWFPALRYDIEVATDPAFAGVFNPMATAIRLADSIGTVSPTYAREIQRPSNPASGFIGGEGLENDLIARAAAGELIGILNGCDYSATSTSKPGWATLSDCIEDSVNRWLARDSSGRTAAIHETALRRLDELRNRRPRTVLTSVGRLVAQKMALLFTAGKDGQLALSGILDRLGENGLLLILGSGDPVYEARLHELARQSANLLFLCGYSEPLANTVYAEGDCFLMPSSYEPCGISQMLAMRAGQPCIVHKVGGLADTVNHDLTGFVFSGNDPASQVQAMWQCVEHALEVHNSSKSGWQSICRAASAQRFDWQLAAHRYIEELYAGE